jgi:2-amino-4-hydroxy-6-hydroxymethyldihydropteridine diphosphokinase
MDSAMVFIGLGTNQGNREANLSYAVKQIGFLIGPIVKQSSVYKSMPWGKPDQPDFLNQVVCARTLLSAELCLKQLASIERKAGRVRTEKWGPRIIDLDILYYNEQLINLPDLVVPHPGIANRKFVLIPLAEIAPVFIHPLLKKNHLQLIEECPDQLEVTLAYKLDTST